MKLSEEEMVVKVFGYLERLIQVLATSPDPDPDPKPILPLLLLLPLLISPPPHPDLT